jgi:hypothetical protein
MKRKVRGLKNRQVLLTHEDEGSYSSPTAAGVEEKSMSLQDYLNPLFLRIAKGSVDAFFQSENLFSIIHYMLQ